MEHWSNMGERSGNAKELIAHNIPVELSDRNLAFSFELSFEAQNEEEKLNKFLCQSDFNKNPATYRNPPVELRFKSSKWLLYAARFQ